MAINYPGPLEARIFYLTNEPSQIAEHVIRFSFQAAIEGDPGDPLNNWKPLTKAGSSALGLFTHVTNLLAVLRPFFNTVTDFSHVELWEYTPGTFDAVFRSSEAIALGGTSGTATSVASQTMMTFRTQGGGIFRLDMRGTTSAPGVRIIPPFAAGTALNLSNYMLDGDSPWIGRDGTYPLATVKFLPGQNEHAWKAVNR